MPKKTPNRKKPTIKMQCRICKGYGIRNREGTDPLSAVLQETECPKCGRGWTWVRWFDAAGKEVHTQTIGIRD